MHKPRPTNPNPPTPKPTPRLTYPNPPMPYLQAQTTTDRPQRTNPKPKSYYYYSGSSSTTNRRRQQQQEERQSLCRFSHWLQAPGSCPKGSRYIPCLAYRLSRRPTNIVGCTCVGHRPCSAPWQPTRLSGVLHPSNVHMLAACPAPWSPEQMQRTYICPGAYSVRYCPPTVSTQPLA